MLQEITRPLSEEEREILSRRRDDCIPVVGSGYWMVDGWRMAFFTILIMSLMMLLAWLVGFFFVGAGVAGFFALMRFANYRRRRKLRTHMAVYGQRLTEDLQSDQAHVIDCRPVRIIEREQFEDEGALWIFDGGDGRYLIMGGQDYEEETDFPSAHFEVVLGTRHRSLIRINSHGDRMQATTLIKGDDVAWQDFPRENIVIFSAPAGADLSQIFTALSAKP